MTIRFSLCIPTMDRFDDFLSQYLEIYLEFKNAGVIDEIIVTDENGNDYQKILNKFCGGNTGEDSPIKVFHNETRLGAFLNKLRVASHAKADNFIAVIDSDNLVDESFFHAARRFIETNCLRTTDDIVLCPSYTISDFPFDYKKYNGVVLDYLGARKYCAHRDYQMLLNTGNYIITHSTYKDLKYDEPAISLAGPYDVIFKHLLSYYQNPRYRVYVVEDMFYHHIVHEGSFYLKEHIASNRFYYDHILPTLCSI
jgi:Glycosyl transferase family 2